jgi:hypothetical protein
MLEALPENDQSTEVSRAPQFTYVPPSHARALNPDNTIVEGMRGAGKSHWWAALVNKSHRDYLVAVSPEAKIESSFEISQGFGVGLDYTRAPKKDTLARLQVSYAPRHIWQAVVAVQSSFPGPFPQAGTTWDVKVGWVAEHPEEYEGLLHSVTQGLQRDGRKLLILFDALDRLADDWDGIRPLARALFQLSLDLLSNRAIRLKLFVRPDMLEDKQILAFPDASKLLAKKVTLSWKRADLYALLFQCIANEPINGSVFRAHSASHFRLSWREIGQDGAWVLPVELRSDDGVQKDVFHALTGPTMASGQHGHKRGFPFTWLPNHLVDSRDQVSPRSFFAALRYAAAQQSHLGWPYALHYKDIQAGVQEASRIRVAEITTEDYPWVNLVMDPLRNSIVVPCEKAEITKLWARSRTLEQLSSSKGQAPDVQVKLLPPHFQDGPSGVLLDLKDLGVIDFATDGRIQMPDVYRIAFGMGRKGGVKPLK